MSTDKSLVPYVRMRLDLSHFKTQSWTSYTNRDACFSSEMIHLRSRWLITCLRVKTAMRSAVPIGKRTSFWRVLY